MKSWPGSWVLGPVSWVLGPGSWVLGPGFWVLLLSALGRWTEDAEARDFTAKDIVHLHPSTTPHPGGFKCFTCREARDNYECNRWAPDLFCPRETRFCYTLHVMDGDGLSLSVSKRCADFQECRFSGCAPLAQDGHKVCSSCCEGNICNLWVPRNKTSAVFSSRSPLLSHGNSLSASTLTVFSVWIKCWTFTTD